MHEDMYVIFIYIWIHIIYIYVYITRYSNWHIDLCMHEDMYVRFIYIWIHIIYMYITRYSNWIMYAWRHVCDIHIHMNIHDIHILHVIHIQSCMHEDMYVFSLHMNIHNIHVYVSVCECAYGGVWEQHRDSWIFLCVKFRIRRVILCRFIHAII